MMLDFIAGFILAGCISIFFIENQNKKFLSFLNNRRMINEYYTYAKSKEW